MLLLKRLKLKRLLLLLHLPHLLLTLLHLPLLLLHLLHLPSNLLQFSKKAGPRAGFFISPPVTCLICC